MNEKLTFNGISTGTFGVFISGEGTFNAPEREVEMITVPGRNGNLAIDRGRFENVTVTYPAFVAGNDQASFPDKIAELRNAFLSVIGYARLEDDYNPDEYRMAVYHAGLEVDPKVYNRAGEFSLEFDCKPQRFLKSGETVTALTSSGSITNPTEFPAKPLLEVVGIGTLTMNGHAIVITGTASQDIYIDLETFEAYSISGSTITPQNSRVSIGNQTPVLSPGANAVALGSGITSVKITPRWWKI